MAFKHGSKTSVFLGSRDLSAYLNAADFSTDVDTADTTTFGATWKTAIAGTTASKAGFQGLYDPTIEDLPATVGVEFGSALTYCPAGALAIGDRARLLAVATTTYAESSPVGGVVAVKWDVQASGAVGFGDVLHVLSEDTNTTTGATKDDTAATATGWIAHLHVTAVDGGSWVVILADASASNFSDGATVATFVAATGATSERIVAATTTTALRRYVRYTATRTGGIAGDGITFTLAYSRNS